MSPDPDSTRQYTDREVRLILKSAVDLQTRAERAGDPTGGMSLTELEQIAGEAGLDPVLIRRAAAQLDSIGPPSESNGFLGSPTEIVLERVVDVVFDPSNFDQLLDVVRAITRGVGEVSTVGRQFGWKGQLDGAKTDVSVSVGDRRTTFRVTVALDEVAVGHFMMKGTLFGLGGGLMGGVGAGAVVGMGPVGLIVGVGIMGTGYLWARHGLRGAAKRYRIRARELIDALASRATSTGREQSPRGDADATP